MYRRNIQQRLDGDPTGCWGSIMGCWRCPGSSPTGAWVSWTSSCSWSTGVHSAQFSQDCCILSTVMSRWLTWSATWLWLVATVCEWSLTSWIAISCCSSWSSTFVHIVLHVYQDIQDASSDSQPSQPEFEDVDWASGASNAVDWIDPSLN